jgi:hypothetical protein
LFRVPGAAPATAGQEAGATVSFAVGRRKPVGGYYHEL